MADRDGHQEFFLKQDFRLPLPGHVAFIENNHVQLAFFQHLVDDRQVPLADHQVHLGPFFLVLGNDRREKPGTAALGHAEPQAAGSFAGDVVDFAVEFLFQL